MKHKIYKITANRRDGKGCTDIHYCLSNNFANMCCEYYNLQREYWYEKYGFDDYEEFFIEEVETCDFGDFISDIEEMKERLKEVKQEKEVRAWEEFTKSEEAKEAFRQKELAELARLKAKYEL